MAPRVVDTALQAGRLLPKAPPPAEPAEVTKPVLASGDASPTHILLSGRIRDAWS